MKNKDWRTSYPYNTFSYDSMTYRELIEATEKQMEAVIDYISFHEGWEETGDKYREHFGFKKKYGK